MLIPYGNRIGGATYVFNGTRLSFDIYYVFHLISFHCSYHLPINDVPGLNNSLHGLLWDRAMTVVDVSATVSNDILFLS